MPKNYEYKIFLHNIENLPSKKLTILHELRGLIYGDTYTIVLIQIQMEKPQRKNSFY